MAKYGFLSVLEEELDKGFQYDYEINWDKRNHAVELAFILEVQNTEHIETLDIDDELATDDIALEEYVVFYNPTKSRIDGDDYLVAIPYEPKKGLSREFLAQFVNHLQEVADNGLDGIMDFLADPEAEEFAMDWDKETFEQEVAGLQEIEFYSYPRY